MQDATTESLALFTGLYMLAAGAGLLLDPGRYAQVIARFQEDAALTYLAAILAFVLGAFIVTVHDNWAGPAAILVSLIGWGALAEGVLLLAAPGKSLALFAPLAAKQRFMFAMGVFAAALGALLIFSALA